MIFRLTKKVQTQIHIKDLPQIESRKEPLFLEEWYVNIFTENRHKYMIFTEGKTMFSYIGYIKGVTSVDLFCDYIDSVMKRIFSSAIEADSLDLHFEKKFGKTLNPKIRGVQVEQVFMALELLRSNENLFNVNKMLSGYLGYKTPAEVFVKELELLISNHEIVSLN